MGKGIRLSGSDLEIIQEAVSYMGRRFFAPEDSRRLLEIEEALDRARRGRGPGQPADLVLGEGRGGLLRRVLDSYADELDHPSSDSSNRPRIAQLRRLGRLAGGRGGSGAGGGLWNRLRRFLWNKDSG